MAACSEACSGDVMGQHLGLGGLDVREALLDHARNLCVQLLSAALEQRVVRCILHQGVLEGVDGIRRCASSKRQSRRGQPRQCVVELGLAHRGHRRDQLVAELSSNRGPDLRNILHGHEAIQPRHQRVPERGRDGDGVRSATVVVAVARLLELPGFENGLGELLHKQRHPVGLGEDLFEQRCRQCLAAGEPGYDRRALRAGELGQVQCADMSLLGPARLELGPMREHDEQRDGPDPIDQQIEHFQCGGIGPVRILEQHHTGLPARGRFGQIDQRPERLVLVLLRGHGQSPVARLAGDGQDRGDEAHIAQRPAVVGDDKRFELVELGLGRLVARELQRPLEVVDAGIEGAVGVVGRALESQRPARLALPAARAARSDAALADTGLSGEQHDLPFAVLRQLPALQSATRSLARARPSA